MSKIPFVDCQGLAGAWTLGTVQTDAFELVARKSLPGGFGDAAVAANRSLIGHDWEQETGLQETWEPAHGVGYLCGTPPCSGFSLLNTSRGANARGSESAINGCMKDLVTYASRCTGLDGRPGPEVVSFESVQGAFTTGRQWMQILRDIMVKGTGQEYHLTHVLMAGSAVGNAQMRHRYYFVLHRVPFGVTNPEKKRVVTYRDAIGDLSGAAIQRGEQPYPGQAEWPSRYALDLRNDSGYFDEHDTVTPRALTRLVDEVAEWWQPGEDMQKAVRRMYEATGRRPENIREKAWLGDERTEKEIRQLGYLKGWSWPVRIHPDKPGYVLTGGGLLSQVHWEEDRLLTAREASRMMGYPDSWDWSFTSHPMQASMLIGKCCPVTSGRWISGHVAEAIRGSYDEDGWAHGMSYGDTKSIGEREWYHNSTIVYKPWLKEQAAEREHALA